MPILVGLVSITRGNCKVNGTSVLTKRAPLGCDGLRALARPVEGQDRAKVGARLGYSKQALDYLQFAL